jgi:hypothetical protein
MKKASTGPAVPAVETRFAGRQAALLVLVLGTGLAVGLALREVFGPGVAPPATPAHLGPVQADPRSLVTQPDDLSRQYTIVGDPKAPDPGSIHPKQRYSVSISRADVPRYAAQAAVNVYSGDTEAGEALRSLLAVGQFGSELPLHESMGAEGHLFAARAGDRLVVVGSILWRDRNVVAYVFVYNPYPDQLPADVVERLARANAYDDTTGIARPIEQRVKVSG